jgi:hydroxymethylpyrimidine pyrophosphatase-like HAD family hydrolase
MREKQSPAYASMSVQGLRDIDWPTNVACLRALFLQVLPRYSEKMPPSLIAIDLDGTLLNTDGRVSARNRAALQLAESAGAEVVIATGRRHAYAMRVLRDLDLAPANALVSSNGTVIRSLAGDLLHRRNMPLETALWICDHAAEFRNTMVLTFDKLGPGGDDTRGALVCERLDELQASIGRWMDSNEPYIAQVDRLEDMLQSPSGESKSPAAPIQMMLCGSVDRMRAAEARLLEHPTVTAVGAQDSADAEIALHRTIYPDRDLCILDILPAGCSKASALLHLAELRGLAATDILAIGDNWNDLPMLRVAGRSVLMSNAPDDLNLLAQAGGWTIAPSNDEDGVAVAIESVFAGELVAAAPQIAPMVVS